jgi:hypothetical protein
MSNPETITLAVDVDTLTTLARLDTEQHRLTFIDLLLHDETRRRQRVAPDAIEQMRQLLDQIDGCRL